MDTRRSTVGLSILPFLPYGLYLSILPYLSSIVQNRELSPGKGLSDLFVSGRPTGKLPYVAHTRQAEYEMVLANWIPRDTHMEKYPTGGIPAGGVYSYPIRSILPALSTLPFIQDRDLPHLSAG